MQSFNKIYERSSASFHDIYVIALIKFMMSTAEIMNRRYEATLVLVFATEGKAEFKGCLGLLLPHFTAITSPSISKPLDQA